MSDTTGSTGGTKVAAHTVTPWELGHQTGEGFTIIREIVPSNGNLLIVATCGTQRKYLGHEIAEDNACANAAHIVRCVNSHDALVEALQATLKAYRLSRPQVFGTDVVQEQAEQALALAKDGGK